MAKQGVPGCVHPVHKALEAVTWLSTTVLCAEGSRRELTKAFSKVSNKSPDMGGFVLSLKVILGSSVLLLPGECELCPPHFGAWIGLNIPEPSLDSLICQ